MNLTFREVADDGSEPSPANPRLTFSTSLSTAQYFTAYAMVETSEGLELGDAHRIQHAELMFNAHRWADVTVGQRPFYVLMHEILHGLGLPHPGAYNRSPGEEITYDKHAEYAQDSGQFTLMSYFGASATGSIHTAFPQTLLLHDIAALQSLYGANTSTRAGDTVYGYGSTAGRSTFDFALNAAPVFTIWDGGGNDTLDFSGTAQAVRVDLREGMFSDAFGMTNNISVAFGAVIENAVGGSGNDRIVGNSAANKLVGGLGNDTLDGGAGGDFLQGGAGDDVYLVDHWGDVVSEEAAQGRDTVYASVSHTLAAEVEDLVLTGAAALNAWGNGLANLMVGNAAQNTLDGGGGADFMVGGLGDDLYVVDHAGDLVIENPGEGRDTVYTSVEFRLGDTSVEDIVLTGALALNVWGNGLANLMVGNAAQNTLDGGAGGDFMVGGAGDDLYIVDDLGDVVIENAGQGRDTVYSSISYTLGDGEVEDLALTGSAAIDASGNAIANLLVGNSGANTLYGAGGADFLVGGGGADVFLYRASGEGGDVIADFQSGVDKIRFASEFGAAGAGFVSGSDPASAGAAFLYDTDDGRLYWDPDGAGGAGPILIASFSGIPALTASDILIG